METRARKRLSKTRKIIRCSILERDEKIIDLTKQQKKEFWRGKNCLNCEQVRQVLELCAICRDPISRDNLLIPTCQHTFCKDCLYQYLDKTSFKYIRLWCVQPYSKTQSESFKCPICKIQVYDVIREKHLKKNLLYTALCDALDMR